MVYAFGALLFVFLFLEVEVTAILLFVFVYLLVQGYGIYYRLKYEKEM